MRSRLRFWKYPLSIVMLLLVIAAFTLVYALSETAEAPYEPSETHGSTVIAPPEPEEPSELEEPEEPEEPSELEEPDEPEEPEETIYVTAEDVGYILTHMDESGIHRGYLLLVNHDHEFNIPSNMPLVNIVEAKTSEFRVQPDNMRLSPSIIEPLDEMMDAFMAATGSRSVAIRSAYRNRESQQNLLSRYISTMGRRMALQYAALPGHSEHHTGLAFDFGVIQGGTMTGFTGTGTSAWFRRNSYRFGFVVRYPQNKTQITQTAYEPWHFRYVGLPHSYIMFQNGWVLEEYINILREHTFENPFEFEHEENQYLIYFSPDTDIKLPLNSEYEISGNNVDGFIITAIILETYLPEITDVST